MLVRPGPLIAVHSTTGAATVTDFVAVTFAAEIAVGATVNVLIPVVVNVTEQLWRLLHAVICVPLSFHTYVVVLVQLAVYDVATPVVAVGDPPMLVHAAGTGGDAVHVGELVPPLRPKQVHVQGPVPASVLGRPAAQRKATGAVAVAKPMAVPH